MKARHPNLLYVFSDEHRYQSMAHTGMTGLQTPHMDTLAHEGVSFTQAISNYPVCSPQRAILMTGRWPHQQGVLDNDIPLCADGMTLGKAFRNAGYATAYIGKWHLGGTRAEPFGFDHSLIWTNTNRHWDSAYHPAGADPTTMPVYNAEGMTEQAIAYLREQCRRGERRPFFLMVSYNPPHSRFTDAPERHRKLYPDETALPWRENVPQDRNVPPVAGGSLRENYLGYHAHVTAVDEQLGRLIAELRSLGLADETILVYTSDHGSMLGSNGRNGKRLPHAESILVPFILRWPGRLEAGRHVDHLFGSIDVMPTLCGLADIAVPPTCEGRDLSGVLLRDDRPPGDDPGTTSQFLMHVAKENASGGVNHPAPIFRGVTTGQYTLATTPEGPWVLFDNEADPLQQCNLIRDPSTIDLQARLRQLTADWLAQAADPFELPT